MGRTEGTLADKAGVTTDFASNAVYLGGLQTLGQ